MVENNSVSLSAIEKAELCKRHSITIFNNSWKKEKDIQKAYDSSLSALERSIERVNLINSNQIKGLQAELLFYKENFQKFGLHSVFASGTHADFTGVINKKPTAFDVTTNPSVKEKSKFQEIKENQGNLWDYYIGLVDLETKVIETNSLLLPICNDNSTGHLILITLEDSEFEEVSDSQVLVRYNPEAGDDDDALEETIGNFTYKIQNPATYYDEIMESPTEILPEGVGEKIFNSYCNNLVKTFHRESGLMISAIVSSKHVFYDRHLRDERWESRIFWSHPHQFIRKTIGNPQDNLIHNIAGIANDW